MNNKYPWIKASGECAESEVMDKVGSLGFDHFIAFCTDKLVAAEIGRLENVLESVSGVLELRLCSGTAELRFFRSMPGQRFTWRLADDTELDPAYMIESRQKLDINTKNTPKGEASFGGKLLRSIGGGVYELPVKDETAVVLVRYLGYNDDGMAYEADFRVKGFAQMEA